MSEAESDRDQLLNAYDFVRPRSYRETAIGRRRKEKEKLSTLKWVTNQLLGAGDVQALGMSNLNRS